MLSGSFSTAEEERRAQPVLINQPGRKREADGEQLPERQSNRKASGITDVLLIIIKCIIINNKSDVLKGKGDMDSMNFHSNFHGRSLMKKLHQTQKCRLPDPQPPALAAVHASNKANLSHFKNHLVPL